MSETLSAVFRIVRAGDGILGLELAQEHLPDLILSELASPKMGGRELMRGIRENAALDATPVILLAAAEDAGALAEALAEGAQDYLTKPFSAAELLARANSQVVSKLVRDTLRRELASQDNDIAQLATELAQRARQLERAKENAEEANRAKDQFLAVLSHELRTPLTPVLAAAIELESTGGRNPETLRDSLRLIRRNVELEARLIDDLLDFTRITKGRMQLNLAPMDAHQAIRGAVEMCQPEIEKKGHRLETALDAAESSVRGDAPRLLQIFWNLISNAVKFTSAGGRITVRTANRDARFTVEISDTGIGIDPAAMPRIFQPFMQGEQSLTRKFGGLGLGLTIAKALADAHGGHIRASSSGGDAGTTMRVELPLASALTVARATTQPSAPASPARPALRILLVEDHEDTRHAMTRLLERWGYSVVVAGSVREALSRAERDSFDLLLSDLGLPDGHGTDVLRELRKKSDITAVAMSGFGMEHDLARTREAGFLAHLVKPIAAQKLRETIETAAAL